MKNKFQATTELLRNYKLVVNKFIMITERLWFIRLKLIGTEHKLHISLDLKPSFRLIYSASGETFFARYVQGHTVC